MKNSLVVLILISCFSLSTRVFAVTDSTKIVESMNFSVTDVNGDDMNFKTFLGKGPLLVNFWALWCEPCKQEMKAFMALSEKLKEKGVSMVSINTDKVKSIAKVRAWVKSQGITQPMLVDPDGSIATNQFSMESLPYSLLLKPDGSVYKKHIGFTAGDEVAIEKELDELLNELSEKK
ncbi:MAG: TlpA disulfide reductase family protein [Bacteroidota bacterium]|nr:TlpA disulfide reductase family protein [Bacteroidota bacterium]MDP4231244.1 TlpA disulfide reductase family protein [Bacteroidota bacterium]MDP4235365.1 TlpA disulfide reductase family protein [Bacteroidota bacterium]